MAQIFTDGLDYTKGFIFQANQPLDLRLIQSTQPDDNDTVIKQPYNGLEVYVTGIYKDDGASSESLHENEVGKWLYLQEPGLISPDPSKRYPGKWVHIIDKDGNYLVNKNGQSVSLVTSSGTINPDLLPSYVDDIIEGNMYSGTYTYTAEGSAELLSSNILLFAPTNSVLPIGSGIDLSVFFGQFSVPIENIQQLVIDGLGNFSVDNIPQQPSPGIIYVDSVSDGEPYKAYRWSGSSFVEIITQTVSAITEDQINSLFD